MDHVGDTMAFTTMRHTAPSDSLLDILNHCLSYILIDGSRLLRICDAKIDIQVVLGVGERVLSLGYHDI